jgi:hypothetical protein
MSLACLGKIQEQQLRRDIQDAIDNTMKKQRLPKGVNANVVLRELTQDAQKRLVFRQFQAYRQMMAVQDALARLGDAKDRDELVKRASSLYISRNDGMRADAGVELLAQQIVAENRRNITRFADIRPRLVAFQVGISKKWNNDLLRLSRGLASANTEARELFQQMKTALDELTDRYRSAGGDVHKRDGWFLPQKWNQFAVHAAGNTGKEFVDDLMGTLDTGVSIIDRAEMKDFVTGQPLSDAELRDVLFEAWESIITNGNNKWREPQGFKGRSSVANKRTNPRRLHFTGEGWVHIANKYGDPDVTAAFLEYQEDLARDIAAMEILGPNPQVTLDAVSNSIRSRLGADRNSKPSLDYLEQLHDNTLRLGYKTINYRVAEMDQAARAGTTAALLGGAFIPAMGDMAVQLFNSVATGTDFRVVVTQLVRAMRNGQYSREELLELGLAVKSFVDNNSGMERFLGMSPVQKTGTVLNTASQAVLEKTLLTPWTDAGRQAALLSHAARIGRDMSKQWRNLPHVRKAFYTTYGITEEVYNRLLHNGPTREGRSFLSPKTVDMNALRDLDRDTYSRIQRGILNEADNSLLTTNTQAEMLLDSLPGFRDPKRAGTAAGILSGQLKMFKRFPAAALIAVLQTLQNQNISKSRRLSSYGVYFSGAMLMGAIALQLNHMRSNGTDPVPMFDEDGTPDPKFWFSAALYGGGIPFVGDVVMELATGGSLLDVFDPTVRGTSVLEMLPTVGLLTDLFDDSVKAAWKGNYGEAGAALGLNIAETGVDIFGGNAWPVRTVLDNMIWTPLRQDLTPDLQRNKERWQRRFAREQGTDHWWRPGEILPDRAPDFSNIRER